MAEDAQVLGPLRGQGPDVAALFRDPDIRAACLALLAENGCRPPVNKGVMWALEKVALGASSYLADAALAWLRKRIEGNPALRRVIDRIVHLHVTSRARDAVKDAMLADLRAAGVEPKELTLDETTDAEVIRDLFVANRFDAADAAMAELSATIRAWFDARDGDAQPVLRWSLQTANRAEQGDIARLKYNAGYALHGRGGEMETLERLLAGDPSMAVGANRFRWLLMTGAGGEGKTRLALAFSDALRDRGWNAGPLDANKLEKFDPSGWRPDRPTLFVIDYPALEPARVRALLTAMQAEHADYDHLVRVLLLEREASGTWHDTVFPADATTQALRQHAAGDAVHPLPPVMPEGIQDMVAERFAKDGKAMPEGDGLMDLVRAIDPRAALDPESGEPIPLPRPLFALAAAEWWLGAGDAPDPAALDRERVLDDLIARERQKRWALAAKDDPDRQAHELLLALTTMCLGLSEEEARTLPEPLATALPALPLIGGPAASPAMRAIGGTADGFRELEPDILGEHFALRILEAAPALRPALIGAAFGRGSDDAGIFALRCLRDFPARLADLDFLAPRPRDGREAALLFARLATDLTNELGEARDFAATDTVLDRLATLRDTFPDDREIALEEAMASNNLVNRAGAAGDWNRVDRAFYRIDALRATDAFPDDREIALAEAKACANLAAHAGAAGDWNRVAAALDRLARLSRAFPEDAAILHQVGAGTASAYDEHRRHGHEPEREDTVEAVFGAGLCLLKGAEIGNRFGAAFSLMVLKDARARFPDDAEIARVIAAIEDRLLSDDFDWSGVPPIPLYDATE